MSQRRVFLLGGANTAFIGKGHPDFVWKNHPDFGKRENPNLEEHLASAVHAAFATTGVNPERVDKGYIGNFVGELFCQQGHLGAALAGSHPALVGKAMTRVEAACASGGLALACAIDAIRAGNDTVLVAGVEVQTTVSAREGADYLARASHYRRQRSIDDFTFPALFGKRTKAYREAFGVTEEDIGRVAVKAYANANKNPLAHMKARKMDLATAGSVNEKNPCFLQNAEYAPYIKMSDCSQVSDGASACLVVSEEGLKAAGKTYADAIEITGYGHSTASLYEDGDLTQLWTTKSAAEKAYRAAGIAPGDVNVAEVHDCFTVTELLMTEALGFAAPGKGADLVKEGATNIDGRIPVNTGGGLVGFGHPVGATGVKQAVEIWKQMKGLSGAYQMPSTPKVGLTANMGGDDRTVMVTAFQNLE
ncbi:acetyl-CoA acetyltransferase [Deltaproteobacteria bacterium]|nr:acetyl-CoA acetyltransferase [Deltaproteobacteria bacterium]